MSAISSTPRDGARPTSGTSARAARPHQSTPLCLGPLARSEALKMKTLRAGKVLTALILASFWGFGALTAFIAADKLTESGSTAAATADVAGNLASLPGAGLGLGAVLFGILGALVVTSEYSTGSITLSLQTVPRRRLLLTAKALVLAAWTTTTTLLGAAGSLAIGSVMMSRHDYTLDLTDPALQRNAVCALLAANGLSLLGLAVGILTRSTVGAVLSIVMLFALVPAVLPMLPSGAAHFADATPSNLLITALATIEQTNTAVWGSGIALLAWGLIPLAIATTVFQRRPVAR